MALIRLILLLALGYFIWLNVKSYLVKSSRRPQAPPSRPERIVKCSYCQLHLPQQQALGSGDSWFCCEEHRRLTQR